MLARIAAAALAVIIAVSISTTAIAGEWLGGQYWGQIGGCAGCGGSLYGGGLPPGAIWVGVVGWGPGEGCGGPDCGCDVHIGAAKGDSGPIFTDEEMPAPESVEPRTIPADEIVPDPPRAASLNFQNSTNRVSYIETLELNETEFRPVQPRVKVITHTSRPERLQRAPLRIVSPDGSAGRMYR